MQRKPFLKICLSSGEICLHYLNEICASRPNLLSSLLSQSESDLRINLPAKQDFAHDRVNPNCFIVYNLISGESNAVSPVIILISMTCPIIG